MIPKNSVVFNSKQTEELLKNGHINSRGKGNPDLAGLPNGFLEGSAYSNGSGKFNVRSSGSKANSTSSKKKNTSSSSTKSSGNSSKSSGTKSNTSSNSSSSSSDSSKETKETLDWIETKLDRIKRDIDLIDKTASSTYKTWSERNKALVSELSQVSNELSVQQQAYDYYIQKANSIGLDGTWAAKVRDGLISIDEITDEDLKTKITNGHILYHSLSLDIILKSIHHLFVKFWIIIWFININHKIIYRSIFHLLTYRIFHSRNLHHTIKINSF